jgi:hypothetical protein
MEHTMKNLATVLGIATFIFGIYYVYAQRPVAMLDSVETEQSMQIMLVNTSRFISHSQELDQIGLDLSVFEDPKFRSLVSASSPLKDRPVGRDNPFAQASISNSSAE